MELRPIGFVRRAERGRAEIVVLPELQDGLYRIEECNRLLILFYFDRAEGVALRVHPHNHPVNPLVGVFASRSPDRPNHIGATAVRLVEVRGNVLVVEGLDAWEGTPVLDIKPEIEGGGPTVPRCWRRAPGKEPEP